MRRSVLIFFLALAGCAADVYIPPASKAHYMTRLSVWIGKNISDIPKDWGMPNQPSKTQDGGERITWPNVPYWGCMTTAIANSSGAIRSWALDGDSCRAEYSREEIQNIQAKLVDLTHFVRTLKRGDHIRLAFYEDAVDIHSSPPAASLDCYFLTYSRIVREITVRTTPEPKHGFTLGKDIYTYELRYISDIKRL